MNLISSSSLRVLAAFCAFSGMLHAEFREFTQRDTGKTLEGKVLGVDPVKETVTMRINGGRTLTFSQNLLVEEDVEHIREWARKNALASRVSISASRTLGERDKQKSGDIYEYRTEQAGYRIDLRNTDGKLNIPEVGVNWYLVVTRSDGKSEVVSGQDSLEFLTAGSSRDISTEMVNLKTSCKSISSCPKCVDFAKSFSGDRLEGVMVELTNSEGEVVQELVAPALRSSKIREAIESTRKSS